jgi:hypothetical protein
MSKFLNFSANNEFFTNNEKFCMGIQNDSGGEQYSSIMFVPLVLACKQQYKSLNAMVRAFS